MKRDISKLTNREIVGGLVENCVRQGEAIEAFETAKYNRLYDQNARLIAELRARPGDGRHDLFPLYDHPNYQVRLNAAKWTYALDRSRARAALASIRDSRWDPYAGDAGMTLTMIDEGIGRLD